MAVDVYVAFDQRGSRCSGCGACAPVLVIKDEDNCLYVGLCASCLKEPLQLLERLNVGLEGPTESEELVRLKAQHGEAAPPGWRIDWGWDPGVDFAWIRDIDGWDLHVAVWAQRGTTKAMWRVIGESDHEGQFEEVIERDEGEAPSVIEAIRQADEAIQTFLAAGCDPRAWR